MNAAIDRLLFEASSVAANHMSAPHRLTAAKEVAAIDVADLATSDQARAYLAAATQQTVIALALVSTDDARDAVAEALRSLVSAARARPKPVEIVRRQAEPRKYWIDR